MKITLTREYAEPEVVVPARRARKAARPPKTPMEPVTYVYDMVVPDEHGFQFAVGFRDRLGLNRNLGVFGTISDAHVFARALTSLTGHTLLALPLPKEGL